MSDSRPKGCTDAEGAAGRLVWRIRNRVTVLGQGTACGVVAVLKIVDVDRVAMDAAAAMIVIGPMAK